MTSPPVSLLAATRPRVETAPYYTETLGPHAVELMARAGRVLDPWQAEACDLMMAVREDGYTWRCFEYCEWVARQNGKGAILEARALSGLFLFGEDLIMWSAHEYKTAMEAFRRCRTLIAQLGETVSPNLILVDGVIPVKVSNTNGEESFERLDTGQRIKFIARSKGSGRGFTGDVNIIDETFAYTPSMQDALMPTMNAVRNPQIIYTSTPPLTGHDGEPMYSLRKRAESGSDPDLGYRDWGLGGTLDELADMEPRARKAWLDDREKWAATNPALVGGRVTMAALERNRRSLGEMGFGREILGIWPAEIAADGGMIDPAVWAALADPDSRPVGSQVFAIDVSPGGHSAAIAAAGRRDDDRLHGKILDHRPGTGWVVDRAKALQQFGPAAWVIDSSGPAGALLADLRAAGIDPDLVSGREMAQACGALAADIDNDTVRHLDQDTLNVAVGQAKPRPLADAWAWDRKDMAGDICPLVAFTLALHGYRTYTAQSVEPSFAFIDL